MFFSAEKGPRTCRHQHHSKDSIDESMKYKLDDAVPELGQKAVFFLNHELDGAVEPTNFQVFFCLSQIVIKLECEEGCSFVEIFIFRSL